MRKLVIVVVLLAACGKKDSDEAKCTHARDVVLALQQKRSADAIASVVDAGKKTELEAQAAKELDQFKTRFVGKCTAASKETKDCIAIVDKLAAFETAREACGADDACRTAAKAKAEADPDAKRCKPLLDPLMASVYDEK